LYYFYHIINKNKDRIKLENPGLGFSYSDLEIEKELKKYSKKIEFKKL